MIAPYTRNSSVVTLSSSNNRKLDEKDQNNGTHLA